jgi:hypothetical protein
MRDQVPRWRLALTLAGAWTLFGCASSPTQQPLMVDGLVFLNAGSMAVSEVSLRIEATHELVTCGFIPVRGECSTTFPERAYRGNSVRLIWTQGERTFFSAPFVIAPPAAPIAGKPATATVTIRDGGAYAAQLVQ